MANKFFSLLQFFMYEHFSLDDFSNVNVYSCCTHTHTWAGMLLLFFHSILIHFNFFCSLSLSIPSSLDFCCFYLFQLIIGLCSFSLVIDLNMFRDDPPSIHLKLESIFERLVMKSEAGGFKNPIISSRIFFNVWMRPQKNETLRNFTKWGRN